MITKNVSYTNMYKQGDLGENIQSYGVRKFYGFQYIKQLVYRETDDINVHLGILMNIFVKHTIFMIKYYLCIDSEAN